MVQLSNSSGTVTKTYDYDAFGVEKNPVATDANPFRYCGEYLDFETNTYYLRARYYDPGIGRFTSEDTYRGNAKDPLSLNLYTYCGNNPIQYYDPSGHDFQDIMLGMALALDKNLSDGFAGWIIYKLTGVNANSPGQYTSEYDFYMGRVIGDVISMAYGAGMSISGILTIIGSVAGGASITIGSGGTLLVGGVAVSVSGVAVGAATTTLGGAIVLSAAGNFGNDLNKMQGAGEQIKASKKDLSKIDDKFLESKVGDIHDFKRDVLKNAKVKDKTLSHYNVRQNAKTGELFLVPNNNSMPALPTGIKIK